jgi:hypothetical protein
VVQADVAAVVTPAVEQLQVSVAEAVIPAALALQDAGQTSLAPTVPAEAGADAWPGAPVAAALIIRWEIGSPTRYTRLYEGLICPPGASGPTGGVGYDFGHQTATAIRAEWHAHPDVERLATASGVVGQVACRAWVAQHRDIRIPYEYAERIFLTSTMPAYCQAAERALGQGWSALTHFAQAGNCSLGYNRGWSMRGDRNREKVAIRDDCAPRGDVACNARELRAMKRLWPDVRGLRDRREDEAVTTERSL